MKKSIAMVLTIALLLVSLAGCTGTTVVIGECTCPADSHSTVAATEPPVNDNTRGAALKTGLAVIASLGDSKSADAGNNGEAAYDVTVVAVTVDDDGIIHSCIIDSLGTSVAFDPAGQPVDFDPAAQLLTKNELGENYGMKAYAGSKYEWYEQAAALAEYAVGKTAEELRSGAVDESGKAPEGSDLASSATIYLGGYVSGIEAAAANAQHLGAQAGDELRLAVISTMDASAGQEEGGAAELGMDVAALTARGDTITSCYIDSLQAQVAFDGTGTITTDLAAPIQTKNELGENYGMVAWGGAIAEWNEQAASFAAYVTGKTAQEVAGIAVTETAKPADGTDLAASVTISIGGFQALIVKAMQ